MFIHGIIRVHEKFDVQYAVIAVPMAVALGVAVFCLEWFWPNSKDLESLGVSDQK